MESLSANPPAERKAPGSAVRSGHASPAFESCPSPSATNRGSAGLPVRGWRRSVQPPAHRVQRALDFFPQQADRHVKPQLISRGIKPRDRLRRIPRFRTSVVIGNTRKYRAKLARESAASDCERLNLLKDRVRKTTLLVVGFDHLRGQAGEARPRGLEKRGTEGFDRRKIIQTTVGYGGAAPLLVVRWPSVSALNVIVIRQQTTIVVNTPPQPNWSAIQPTPAPAIAEPKT